MLAFAIVVGAVPPPLSLADTERLIVVPVSAEVRSDTVKHLATPLPEAVRFVFHCEMNMGRGEPTRRIEAGTRYPKNWEEYRVQAREFAAKLRGDDADPLLNAAHSRVTLIRVRKVDQSLRAETKIMTFAETIAPSDLLPDAMPAPTIEVSNLLFSQTPSAVDVADLYPAYAMRSEVGARTTVTCRIKDDLTLSCRNANAQPNLYPDNPDYERISSEFRLASYQLMSLMKALPRAKDGSDVVGKDFEYSVNWLIPR
jgi:hypothetical protein